MRLEQLIYLIDVAKTNSITIAAERNYVTQQNISEAIAKLENELEVTLLYRSHKGCSLTEAGVEAVKGAKIIIDNVENLKSTLKPYSNNNSKVRGDLSINSIPAVMRKKFLAEILLEFGNKYPDVVLSVNENNNIDIIRNVISEKIDIGLIAMVNGLLESNNITEKEFNNNIYFERLYDDDVLVCVGKNSPLRTKKTISIDELKNYPLVSAINSDFFLPFISKLKKKKFDPSVLLNTSSYNTQYEIISKGSAVGFSMASDFEENQKLDKQIIAIPFAENIKLTIGWIRAKNRPLSPAAEEFITCLKSKC